jgi:hypothetical protein
VTIDFTKERVEQLRVLYDEAVAKELEQFSFYGQPLNIDYAKHLLDYLEGVYEIDKRKKAN